MALTIQTSGLKAFQRYVEAAPEIATVSARIALNAVAARALRSDVPKTMRTQVAFPPAYLEDPARLSVDRPATNGELMTSILGRDRPTSLARFAEGLAAFGVRQTEDVYVTVKPGNSRIMKKVFALKLRAGAADSGNFNIGLAIRLKPGEILQHRVQGNQGVELPSIPNVYLLYGPSVGQVFDDVADELAEPLGDDVETEFVRQFLFRSEDYFK